MKSLRGMAEVLVAYTVSGEYDLMVEIAATDAEDLDQLLSKIGRLPGVGRTTSFILLSREDHPWRAPIKRIHYLISEGQNFIHSLRNGFWAGEFLK